VELDLVECCGRLKELGNALADILEMCEHARCVNVRLAAEELIIAARPAVVDAARLRLGALDELGHDRLRRLPILDRERRLDAH